MQPDLSLSLLLTVAQTVKMQRAWIVAIFSILTSMGLLTVILGQYQMMDMLKTKNEKMTLELQGLYNEYEKESKYEVSLEQQVAEKRKEAKEMEESLNKRNPEIETKRKEYDTCQHELEKQKDELSDTETQAVLKAESDAWNQEIKHLKDQLNGYRPICDYVKENTLAARLCGNNPS